MGDIWNDDTTTAEQWWATTVVTWYETPVEPEPKPEPEEPQLPCRKLEL